MQDATGSFVSAALFSFEVGPLILIWKDRVSTGAKTSFRCDSFGIAVFLRTLLELFMVAELPKQLVSEKCL